MPISKKRKKPHKSIRSGTKGNPMAKKNRRRVFAGDHPTNPHQAVSVPAPMVSKRHTPAGHIANLQGTQKDVLIGFNAMQIIEQLSTECIERLRESSLFDSASNALTELIMNRVTPKNDLVDWLERRYLGTWDRPEQAVESIIPGPMVASMTEQELIDAYRRSTQVFMIREHYFENGRVAVSFAEKPPPLATLLMLDWILDSQVPDTY